MWLGIYIIIIGWSVCRQLCDWSAHSVGLASAGQYARAGPARMCGQGLRAARTSHSRLVFD